MKRAHYDSYDYPSYWDNRDYEHESEVLTLREFLNKIPKIESILDLGCGFGRLSPYYLFRAKKIVLADPSSKLLEEAQKRISSLKQVLPKKLRNISFVQSSVESVNQTFKSKQFDAVLMVRVMHHLKDPELTIKNISKVLKPGGYLILEFANKIHGKAALQNILRGDFTFLIDIFPTDRKSAKTQASKSLPFLNYHPDVIKELLKKNGFKTKEIRSVSNIRSVYIKKHVPIPLLISLEKLLQKPLAKVYFGPSIFILARKKEIN